MRAALALLAALVVPVPARAQDGPTGGAKVYRQAVPAVVFIQSTRPNGLASGSGALVDAGKRLVLTNYHVVEDNPKATVLFPEFRDGSPVAERQFYKDRADRFGIPGRVLVVSKTTDLAVVQLDRIPDGLKAIALAAGSPEPGETVHSIGNAGKSGALWGYVRGTVRQVYRKKWQAELSPRRVQTFDARVVETDSPTNPGDSGGPLLNDAGQFVGVTQGGATNAASVSYFVDLTEVRKILASPEVRAARGTEEAKAPKDLKAATVKDGADVFGKPAVEEANALLAELAKAGRDVHVETLAAAPADLRAKAKAATATERTTLFNQFAERRLADEKSDGVIVFICLDPRVAVVVVGAGAVKAYPAGTAKKAKDTLLAGLKDKDNDKALVATLKVFRDAGKLKRNDD